MCSSQTQLKGINYKAERLRLHTWPYVHACMLSRFICVQLFATPWTVAHQAPLSVGFPRQEYWSALPCPPPGDLPDPGMEPVSPASPALAGGFFTPEPPRKPVSTNPSAHSSTYTLVHHPPPSLNHPSTHPPQTCPPRHPGSQQPSFIHPLIQRLSSTHHPPTHPSIHLLMHPSIHLLNKSRASTVG